MKFRNIWFEENGQAVTEYGLTIAFIAFAAFTSIVLLREEIMEMISRAISVVSSSNDSTI